MVLAERVELFLCAETVRMQERGQVTIPTRLRAQLGDRGLVARAETLNSGIAFVVLQPFVQGSWVDGTQLRLTRAGTVNPGMEIYREAGIPVGSAVKYVGGVNRFHLASIEMAERMLRSAHNVFYPGN